jgi:hypothetical protein
MSYVISFRHSNFGFPALDLEVLKIFRRSYKLD